MIYYYTYRIVLLKGSLKHCYYLGRHKTKNLNDNYHGSGRILKDYFKKYKAIEGKTYIKEIIAFYDNEDDLNKAEAKLVGDKYNTDKMCLNLRAGGVQAGMCEETLSKLSKAQSDNWKDEDYRNKMSISLIEASKRPETHKKRSDSAKGNDHAKGSIRTEEYRQKQSEIHKELYKDESYHLKVSEGTKAGMQKPEVKLAMHLSKLNKHWRLNTETNKREWYD